jgi:hypothetical protein
MDNFQCLFDIEQRSKLSLEPSTDFATYIDELLKNSDPTIFHSPEHFVIDHQSHESDFQTEPLSPLTSGSDSSFAGPYLVENSFSPPSLSPTSSFEDMWTHSSTLQNNLGFCDEPVDISDSFSGAFESLVSQFCDVSLTPSIPLLPML